MAAHTQTDNFGSQKMPEYVEHRREHLNLYTFGVRGLESLGLGKVRVCEIKDVKRGRRYSCGMS